jgi:hypothetical protein
MVVAAIGNQNARKHNIPRELIERLYVVDGKSIAEIERITGCPMIYREMCRLGIPRRSCRRSTEVEPTPSDVGYAAGFFDGEGSINIKNPARKTGYRLVVAAAQTAIEPLEWLKERWGGSVRIRRKRSRRRPAWEWSATSSLALRFLEHVYPLLIVKKDQAAIAIDFQSRKGNGMRHDEASIRWEKGCREKLHAIRSSPGPG